MNTFIIENDRVFVVVGLSICCHIALFIIWIIIIILILILIHSSDILLFTKISLFYYIVTIFGACMRIIWYDMCFVMYFFLLHSIVDFIKITLLFHNRIFVLSMRFVYSFELFFIFYSLFCGHCVVLCDHDFDSMKNWDWFYLFRPNQSSEPKWMKSNREHTLRFYLIGLYIHFILRFFAMMFHLAWHLQDKFKKEYNKCIYFLEKRNETLLFWFYINCFNEQRNEQNVKPILCSKIYENM